MVTTISPSLVHFMLWHGRRSDLDDLKSSGQETISILVINFEFVKSKRSHRELYRFDIFFSFFQMRYLQLNPISGENPLLSPKKCEPWLNGFKTLGTKKAVLVTGFPQMIFKRKNVGLL